MSSTAQTLAGKRIASLLDENSFVEIGGYVTARNTDFNLSEKETPADGVITGYGVIDGLSLIHISLTKFCCESPGFYQIFQMAFSNFQKSSMVGTDGETFFYEPKFFLQLYMEKGIKGINRFFFHTLFHLLYGQVKGNIETSFPVSYTHLRSHSF